MTTNRPDKMLSLRVGATRPWWLSIPVGDWLTTSGAKHGYRLRERTEYPSAQSACLLMAEGAAADRFR